MRIADCPFSTDDWKTGGESTAYAAASFVSIVSFPCGKSSKELSHCVIEPLKQSFGLIFSGSMTQPSQSAI